MSAHTPAEWAAVFGGAAGVFTVLSTPVLLLDHELPSLPRPEWLRLVENPVGDRLCVEIVNARHAVHEFPHRAALSLAALLLLLSGPKEALR